MSRLKVMFIPEFDAVFDRAWQPVILEGDAVPGLLRGIPEDRLYAIIASGELMATTPYRSQRISGRLVGGIDVYRRSPDDPVPLNKDWYAVVVSDATPKALFVEGPFKDSEHWLSELPQRYARAETIRVEIL